MFTRTWVLGFVVAALLAACSSAQLPPGATPSGSGPQTLHAVAVTSPTPPPLLSQVLSPIITSATNLLPVCAVVSFLQANCGAIRRADVLAAAGSLLGGIPGYHPSDLQSAYHLPSNTAGYGQTVGIVVAYDDPMAESDLSFYRSKFGLPACASSIGCFKKIGQFGTAALPAGNEGWAQETSIDLDIVSAVCPHCHLLLVEANSSSIGDLTAALQTAVSAGATVVNDSFMVPEAAQATAYDAQWYHPGTPIVAGAGDSGFGVGWPASSPHVTAVGGTTLRRNLTGGFSETAWSGTGSGCSAFISKPAWQTDGLCKNRTVVDVAADADPNTGVAVYDTYFASGNGGWLEYGGTSVASAIVSGVYALAGNGRSISDASYIYAHAGLLNDVHSGSNGSCNASYLCTAVRGYDGPTGLGSPNGVGAF